MFEDAISNFWPMLDLEESERYTEEGNVRYKNKCRERETKRERERIIEKEGIGQREWGKRETDS